MDEQSTNDGYRILSGSDPLLKQQSVEFTFDQPIPPNPDRPDLVSLIDAKSVADHLRNVLQASKGLGVSAPQIGLFLRVIAVGDPNDAASIIVAFNPILLDEFGDTVKYEEGCLSFPGLYLRIRRKANIRVRYTTEDGVTDTIKLSGLTARVFQHEIDHLDGILFTDRVDNFELTRARNKQKQMMRRIKQTQKQRAAQEIQQQAVKRRMLKGAQVTVKPTEPALDNPV